MKRRRGVRGRALLYNSLFFFFFLHKIVNIITLTLIMSMCLLNENNHEEIYYYNMIFLLKSLVITLILWIIYFLHSSLNAAVKKKTIALLNQCLSEMCLLTLPDYVERNPLVGNFFFFFFPNFWTFVVYRETLFWVNITSTTTF